MTIKELKPESVWRNFYELTRIPRPSKKEEKVIKYLYEFGQRLGLETIKDEIGNIIIRKPATPGMENRKGVILQGHMDMVPQKNANSNHDFENDPIETWIDGDWVRAKETTLGADNGIGVAMGLAVLESKDIKHGPLEVLITVDEETGLTGAAALKGGLLNGDILLNLDSEDEGEFCIGCAGGLDMTATADYTPVDEPEGYECWSISVKGLCGGHSGTDITLYRANANIVMARIINKLMLNAGVKLLDFEGGNLRNAIPREAFATVYVPADNIAKAQEIFAKVAADIKAEYSVTDPDASITFEPYQAAEGECCGGDECKYVDDETALKYMRAILGCPNGIEKMSSQVPGLVETSNNTAMVKIGGGHFYASSLMRSSVDSAKEALAERAAAVFALAGIRTEFTGGYSGWAPNGNSEILKVLTDLYSKMYGVEPKVLAIHAGLECGILAGAYPHWDMVSFGPTIVAPHSPDERVSIASVASTWEFLKEVLAKIPEKI